MAFQTTNFVDPLPRLSENNWFSLDERFDDDALLTQEEEEYKLLVSFTVVINNLKKGQK